MSGEQRAIIGSAAAFAFGAIAGFFVWAASLWLVGEKEPWDTEGNFYYLYIFIAGIIAGAAIPKWFWLCPAGIYAGQAIAIVLLIGPGPLVPLGLYVALPLMCGLNLVGCLTGAVAHIGTVILVRKYVPPHP